MKNDILEHRRRVIDNICKSFGENIDIEKAHYHGEVHPNGKWYWNSQANRGRGDWRVIKKKTETKEETKEISSKPIIPEENKEIESARKSFSNKSTLNKILEVLRDDKVHFEEGLAIAMDGNVLITMKTDYPEELENSTTDKNLKRIDIDFPDWKSITSEHITGVYEDSKDVLEALEKIKDISNDFSSIGIKIGNEYFGADYIYKILSIKPEMNLFQDKNDNLILRDQENLLFCFVTPLRKNISGATRKTFYSPKDILKYPPKEEERAYKPKKIYSSEIDFNNVKYVFVGKESGENHQGNYYFPGELGYVQTIANIKKKEELDANVKNGDFTKIKLPNNEVIMLYFKKISYGK